MARYDDNRIINSIFFILICILPTAIIVNARDSNEPLTACQHLRQAESRRAKSLNEFGTNTARVRVPKCSKLGEFEPVQCSNELNGTECWCVDEYGIEIIGTRRDNESDVNCNNTTINECPASSCRMFCPAGFARDARSGCSVCQCRDPCEGVVCPGGLACQPQEVTCNTEPCPPVPTCKRARSLSDLCPAGQPLTIVDTNRPFLCGNDLGKPPCPPLFKCMVQSGNDYGVCCPSSMSFKKPGECPNPTDIRFSQSTGVLCGTPCSQDLECPRMEKCCQTMGCGSNCQPPHNVTSCHQARMLSEILSVNEREGRGYIPSCNGPLGTFSDKQCSRNGLVCWCVDQQTGNKIKGSMGASNSVNCKDYSKSTGRSQGRSVDMTCDQNICASVCEYGFKNDHNGCATCECSEPCDGYHCPMGSHCEVAKDPECRSGSALCASEPVCKPDFVYSNPCEVGTPLVDNITSEVMYCHHAYEKKSRAFQSRSYWDDEDPIELFGRSLKNVINCPEKFQCTKLHKETQSVCCPKIEEEPANAEDEQERPQTMCEYIRNFSDRMEGTEEGMVLALPTPSCNSEGAYDPSICIKKKLLVTRAEQRQIIERNNIRQMKALLRTARQLDHNKNCPLYKCVPCPNGYEIENGCQTCKCKNVDEQQRTKRDTTENLRLHQVSQNGENNENQLDVKNIIRYLRQNIMVHPQNDEANYLAEILSRKLLNQVVQERNAKVIDFRIPNGQNLDTSSSNSKNKIDKTRKLDKIATKADSTTTSLEHSTNNDDLVEIEVDECWCVDGFGTEIPESRGYNVTQQSCQELRDSLECLDITCRMGCDYGFVLDPITKCPSCECRDPCDNVICSDNQECRSVEVSCDGEYCPPVPACLPKKPGQCPFLVPPGTEGSTIDVCEYECRSDAHCEDSKRCCSNGCGTQCVEPQLKTACQHLQTIQLHQASELGIPARQKYIAQCDPKDGSWLKIQCGPGDVCWCIDERGNEISGTRTHNAKPSCDAESREDCPINNCKNICEHGYIVDDNGCGTCDCRDPCKDSPCPAGEICQLVKVECIDEPCPKMPVCMPERESICSEGIPLKLNGRDMICGPQSDAETCPSTHTCQLDMNSRKGVCCGKTRDVCFEFIETSCMKENGTEMSTSWRFSPKMNKCVRFAAGESCQSKNSFHSEAACAAVCPVLSPCERLRLRNSLAAKRAGQPLAWFQPRCDPETGSWSPVQCLGKSSQSPSLSPVSQNSVGRGFSIPESNTQSSTVGVCWCADKKGAPVKGTLTRGIEPMCNHRQARRRMSLTTDSIQDTMMEELIRQLTLAADEDNFLDAEIKDDAQTTTTQQINTTTTQTTSESVVTETAITERILEIANSIFVDNSNQPKQESSKKLHITITRCQALQLTALFPVACDNNGAFESTQCNEAVCWCVDAAGNQLPETTTFSKGSRKCLYTPIDQVSIELHLLNTNKKTIHNLYDVIKDELIVLLGDTPDNLRVHENLDETIYLKFDLSSDNKIDTAFAIEEMVKHNDLILGNGQLRPDITLSRFIHRNANLPIPQSTSFIPENTFQTIVFILATTSAFMVSIFVVFIMLKRGKNKMKQYNTNKTTVGMGDKFLDYSSPIFVLSAANNNEKTINSQKET